jgi:site-specific DNA recombinase
MNMDQETPEIIRAGIYARVSSGKQAEGYSLNEQIALCRERCELNGWTVNYIFREDGESASTTDRPKFRMMMQRAEAGMLDIIIFWKLDRFCRSLIDVVNVEKQLRDWGVKIISMTESIDTTTSSGRFVFRTLASAAQWEREMIKERTTMGLKALAKQHKWPNKTTPLGYAKNEEGYLVVDNHEKKLVQMIFREYIRLRSMPQLAFILNEKKIKTKKGKRWTASTIMTILDNRIYIGEYDVCGVQATLNDCKILRTNTFDEAQIIRKRHAQNINAMPMDRKTATVEKMINDYLSFLRGESENISSSLDPQHIISYPHR